MNYLKVSYPALEAYFVVPTHWAIEDLQVRHGALYYKGKATLLMSYDCVSSKQELELISKGHMDFEDCVSFVGE